MNVPRGPKVLIPLFAVALLLLGVAVWKQMDPTPPTGQGNTDDALTQTPGTIEEAASATAGSAAAAAGEAAPADLLSQMGVNTDPEKVREQQDRELAELEARHRSEPVDAAWKGKAETALSKIAGLEEIAISGIKPNDYVGVCRSETCRVSARFKSYGDAQDWGTMFVTSSGETFRQAKVIVVPNPDGSSELRIFGMRR